MMCKECEAEMIYWVPIRQGIPSYYECPHCYRRVTPGRAKPRS